MTSIQSILKRRAVVPRRTVLFGVAGVRKSTFAAMAEKPILIPMDEDKNHFPLSAAQLSSALQAAPRLGTSDEAHKGVSGK